MAGRKEPAHRKARKANGVRVESNAVQRLAAFVRSEISGVGCDVRNGCPKQLGAASAVGTQRKRWESIIQQKLVILEGQF